MLVVGVAGEAWGKVYSALMLGIAEEEKMLGDTGGRALRSQGRTSQSLEQLRVEARFPRVRIYNENVRGAGAEADVRLGLCRPPCVDLCGVRGRVRDGDAVERGLAARLARENRGALLRVSSGGFVQG
jgi:hypothetical protein